MSGDRPAQVTGTARLRGRQAQAAHNDELILQAAREVFLADTRRALASDDEPWEAWTGFLRRIVAANTHGLTVRLAGTFAPSAEQFALAEEMRSLAVELFERVRDTGLIRDDVTFLDVEFLLEFLAGIKLG